jgi:DHA1 family bicyclomycin/chloramphenicol resistance-like MFS transporter
MSWSKINGPASTRNAKVIVHKVNRPEDPCITDRPPAPGSGRVPTALIAVLTALNAVAPFSIDMYLSAFPRMARDFNASTSSIQLSLTAFLIGLAGGQLIIGQLSDRYGRRIPLIVGSATCLGASVLCILAPSIEILICLRFVQGFAGAAGVVIARAVIADRARGRAAVQIFSTLNVTSVLAPIAAPVLGGVIVTGLGWRAVFAALAVMNLCTLLGVVLFVEESLPEQRRRPSGLRASAASICSVLSNRHYLGYTTSSALITAAMFAYVSASPFVLQDIVGQSPAAYSYTFAACSVAVAAGSALARCIAKSVAPRRVLVSGVIALTTITALILSVVTIGEGRPGPTIALMGCFMATIGFVYGHANMLATTQVHHAAGTGSAVLGFLQYVAGAIASPLVGVSGHGSAVPMGVVMFSTTSAAAATLLICTRGHGGADERGAPLIGAYTPP